MFGQNTFLLHRLRNLYCLIPLPFSDEFIEEKFTIGVALPLPPYFTDKICMVVFGGTPKLTLKAKTTVTDEMMAMFF